jgi:hypothetical protein
MKHNFGAGPCILPQEVMAQAAEAVVNFNGLSILEISHRSKDFVAVMDEAQEKGIAAEVCADKILKGLAKKKVELLIGREELILVYMKRWFPSLYYKFVLKVKPN